MAAKQKWRLYRRKLVAVNSSAPGVWATKDGGWWIRGRKKVDGVNHELSRFLPGGTLADAVATRDRELALLGNQLSLPKEWTFRNFALWLVSAKRAAGEIRAESGYHKWLSILEQHLCPVFGDIPLTELRYSHLSQWRVAQADLGLSPRTINTRIAVLKVITKAATRELELESDPGAPLQPLSVVGHRTYTFENPNALTPETRAAFLGLMRDRYPQHYAFVALGFLTGLRPSSLRPLRRCGPDADIKWDEAVLLVRRSEVDGWVTDTTKTGADGRIALPEEAMEDLLWHVRTQLFGKGQESELLFPSRTGGFRSRSSLDKPFALLAKELNLGFKLTPRAMRRTFQDSSRDEEIPDVVTRSISGHATAQMQQHYSSVNDREQRAALSRVAAQLGIGQIGREAGGRGAGTGKDAAK